MNQLLQTSLLSAVGLFPCFLAVSEAQERAVTNIGSRLELMLDEHLIETMTGGAHLQLHRPVMREVSFVTDKPWEGKWCSYWTFFQDGDLYRAYYGGWHGYYEDKKLVIAHLPVLCYAESRDGIHWERPELGLVEFDGSRKNNIILSDQSKGAINVKTIVPDNVSVFKDSNPNCPPDALYKVIMRGQDPDCLVAFKSSDGIHFSPLRTDPFLTGAAFDSQNLVFWDTLSGQYRAYFRDFIPGLGSGIYGLRSVKTATSPDFNNWSEHAWLDFLDAPHEHIYTNQIQPYYRAPHIFLGFPMRYHNPGWTEQTKALPGFAERERRAVQYKRYGSAVTDGLFMSSRDGIKFKRWGEAIIRPGLRPKDNWVYGDNNIACGMLETKSSVEGAPNELSLYATESYWTGKSVQMRRFTYRIDGFVSVNAPLTGGEFVTKPFLFEGSKLLLNFSTSAAGNIRVEIQDDEGLPIEGFALADSTETYGDELERVVQWNGGSDVARLAGKPVRLRIILRDADLFSFRFQ